MTEPIDPEIVRIEARIFAERLSRPDILRRAGVNRATWFRWVRGDMEAKRSTIRRLDEAIDAAISDRSDPTKPAERSRRQLTQAQALHAGLKEKRS